MGQYILEVLAGGLFATGMGIMAWILTKIYDFEHRITAIETKIES